MESNEPDEERPKKLKRSRRYPHKTIALSIEQDEKGEFKRMMSVTHQNLKCIHKALPKALYKFECKWRTKPGRCRKRLAWGHTVQLTDEGRCPGYGTKIPREMKKKEEEKEL